MRRHLKFSNAQWLRAVCRLESGRYGRLENLRYSRGERQILAVGHIDKVGDKVYDEVRKRVLAGQLDVLVKEGKI